MLNNILTALIIGTGLVGSSHQLPIDRSPLNEFTADQKSQSQWLIDQYVFHGNEVILDLCSGDGKLCAYLAEKVPKGSVVGVDVSNSMILFKQKKYHADNLRFQIANVTQLPYQDQFDVVASFNTLHLLADQKNLWASIMRCLKPGGVVLMQFPNQDGFQGTLQETMQMSKWKKKFINFSSGWHYYPIDEYRKWIVHSGLIPQRIELKEINEIYPNVESFKSSIELWLPQLIPISKNQREDFLADLTRNYLKKTPLDEQGYLHFKVIRLEIEAEKPK